MHPVDEMVDSLRGMAQVRIAPTGLPSMHPDNAYGTRLHRDGLSPNNRLLVSGAMGYKLGT